MLAKPKASAKRGHEGEAAPEQDGLSLGDSPLLSRNDPGVASGASCSRLYNNSFSNDKSKGKNGNLLKPSDAVPFGKAQT